MTKDNLTLYHYWRSSCSWRIRWALALKGVSYNSVTVDLVAGEQRLPKYLQLNPAGTVPCLVADSLIMTESLAILEWLDERFIRNPLLPASAADRWKARQLALTVTAGTQPLQNLSVLKYLSEDANIRNQWAAHWISQGLQTYESLIQSTAGTFSIGSQLTIADLCLIPQCYNAIRFNVDLHQWPTIVRIYRHAIATNACETASPHKQPGALPGSKQLLP
jgi:maleylacetoacetate isomerase